MGGDPTSGESVTARRAAGVRGDRRGRCWGSILSDCSYSRAGRGGCDGGVGIHGGGVRLLNNSTTCSCLLYHYYRPYELQCLVSFSGCSLSSLVDGMEGKEHEREEN